MAKLEAKREYPSKTAEECYRAGLMTMQQSDYQIIKKRDIASLVIGEGKLDGQTINATIVVPFGSPVSVLLTLEGDVSLETLRSEADRLYLLLEEEI